MAVLPPADRPLLEQTLELARALIQVDTTNPPGRETAAARVLIKFLQSRGIETELIESADERGCVAARVAGRRPGRPGLLLSHLDVSPVQPDFWTVPPFGAIVRDGYVWGRGAIDLKTLAAAHAVALADLVAHGRRPARDVLLLSVADETRGGAMGIRWLERERPELLDVAWVLGEGSFSYPTLLGSRVPVFTFCPEEKTALWLRLTALGAGGHASVPRGGTAVERLVTALERIHHRDREESLGPVAVQFVATLTSHAAEVGLDRADILGRIRETPAFAAMLGDTISATIVRAGEEPSVVPSEAAATLDCRLLPTTDPDVFIEAIKALVVDLDIRIDEAFRAVSGSSDPEGPIPQALGTAIRSVVPGALVSPVVSAGYTDLRIFRAQGVPAYGCHVAPLTLIDRATIAGHDERIPTASLDIATRVVQALLQDETVADG